mgnify:FL=1
MAKNVATTNFQMNIDNAVQAIALLGSDITHMLRGDMGNGKSSTLPMVGEILPKHILCYVDCSMLDLGDVMLPDINEIRQTVNEEIQSAVDKAVEKQVEPVVRKYVTYAPNEAFGIHFNVPVIIMLDELGKANQSVQLALTRLMQERQLGNMKLPEGSIVYATTNKGSEGVGDMMRMHTCNRLTFIDLRKSNNMEWIEWGINKKGKKINPIVLGYAKDNPQIFAAFEDVERPEDNLAIFHPKDPSRVSFVTGRSLEKASHILDQRDKFDTHTLTCLLMGTLGAHTGKDIMTFVTLADKLVKREDILKDPNNAPLPQDASSTCMVIFKALASMDREFVTPFMTYLDRLSNEAKGMFANGVRDEKYFARTMVMNTPKFQEFAGKYNYMFAHEKV